MALSGHIAALLGITATVRERWDGLTVANQAAGEGRGNALRPDRAWNRGRIRQRVPW